MSGDHPGVSYAELNAAIRDLRDSLRSEIAAVERDLGQLQSWTESEIRRLESEMRALAEQIVAAIDRQTTAMLGGVAATTAMVERTRAQIESDFRRTVGTLETQTESTLQIEVGRKLADAGALKGKRDAFSADIAARFDKAIASVAMNRELYDLHFRKIIDEYRAKVDAIGAHIFQIRLEDIAPAVRAAETPYEQAHSLPIEMDLRRLAARAGNLDDTLRLLKSQRLDEVLSSQPMLDSTLAGFAIGDAQPGPNVTLCVEAIATASADRVELMVGQTVSRVGATDALVVSTADASLAVFQSPVNQTRVAQAMDSLRFREPTAAEIQALARAVASLHARRLVSDDARALFEDFLGSGSLSLQEA